MKRIVAWPLAYSLYWLGHGVSRVMNNRAACVLYPLYSRLMIASCDLSDWAGLGIWKPAREVK